MQENKKNKREDKHVGMNLEMSRAHRCQKEAKKSILSLILLLSISCNI